MFKTKKDVDRHVRTAMSKLRTENEKNLRGFTIAKLYFKINEYATAQNYISSYLLVKEDCAPAHTLLGYCYQQLKKPDKALASFQRSLQLNSKQPDILIEVCKLFLADETSLNPNKAKYWCDLAESEKVQHDAVFSLRLKLLHKDNLETTQIEDIILKEIASRPTDPNLRIRLVRHFIEQNKILDAFKYAYDLEMKHYDEFSNCAEWYNIVWVTLTKYKQLTNTNKNWEFWLLLIICLERQVYLSFFVDNNYISSTGGTTERANLLFSLDQYLYEASQCILTLCSERELGVKFLSHYRGQLCLHASSLIFKREQIQNKNQWKETTKNAVPLLLLAYYCEVPDAQASWLKHSSENAKQLIQLWNREGAFRCSQAGRTLLSCVDDSTETTTISSRVHQLLTDRSGWSTSDDLLVQTRKLCSDNSWRQKIFRILFPNSDQIIKMQSSLLTTCQQFVEPHYELPSCANIETYEEIAQYLKPQSLSHMVYLCLGASSLADVRCKYFSGLNFSTQNLAFCGAESLNQLDIETFLYAATIQAKRSLELEKFHYDNYNSKTIGRPLILPFANLSSHLCTEEQINWWMSAYQVYKNLSNDNLGELRATLQYGIEAIRGINGPKIDLLIVLQLGNIFVTRVHDANKPIEKTYLETRVENLYKYGLNMLKLHTKGVLEPYRKFFKYNNSNSSSVERQINSLAEEAVTHLAARHFKSAEYEECIEELSGIQLPFATYFLAEAYRKLDESNKTPKKSKKLYLDKAKDYLNQTLNLLSFPNIDDDHPLKSIIPSEIKRLQYTTKFGNDSFSNGYQEGAEFLNETPIYNHNRSARDALTSSPKSVELENLVKQMHTTLCLLKDELIDIIKPEVSGIKNELVGLKEKLANIEENMKKKSAPPSRDEANVLDDLYMIDDELQTQIYGNQQPLYSGYNQQQQRINTPNALINQQTSHLPHVPPSHHQQAAPPPNPYNNLVYNTNYPMNYYTPFAVPPPQPGTAPLVASQRAPLGLNHHVPFVDHTMSFSMQTPPQNALQNAQGIQNDNRSSNLFGLLTQPTPQQIVPQPTTDKSVNQSLNTTPNIWNRLYNNAPVEKGPPVNVVITSSDPLPAHTSVVSAQSTLSVTIPPQHIKSNLIANDSLNTQTSIQMQQQGIGFSFPMLAQNISFPGLNQSSIGPITSTSSSTKTNTISSSIIPPTVDVTAQFKVKDPLVVNPSETISSTSKTEENSDDLNKSHDSEYDPRPDFKPLIPLPDEVEVVTGEENEEVLFCSRAKLLRHVDKEWKERGIGDIKILKNKLDGKIRILMRREQTHKICANHAITSELNLVQAKGGEKSYIWVANDFADEILKVETLCVRFKQIETAKEFYNVFIKAQKAGKTAVVEADSNTVASLKAAPTSEISSSSTPITKSPTFNFGKTNTPAAPTQSEVNTLSASAIISNKSIFSITNNATESINNMKPDVPTEVKTSPFASFSFDNSNVNKTDELTTTASINKPFANIFANLQTSTTSKTTVTYPIVTTQSHKIAEKKEDSLNKSTEGGEEDDYVPTAQFKPVIPLPDLVEVQTGEENETVLFEHRAKLLRFDKITNEWKERGIGNIKLLVDKNDVNRVRLVMRREIVFKLCCNQRITKDLIFKQAPNTQSALTWCGQDFSENELHTEVLTIRFKTAEISKNFHDAILKAQENMTNNGSPSPLDSIITEKKVEDKGFGDKFKPQIGSWNCTGCYVSNQADSTNCIACNAPKLSNVESLTGEPKTVTRQNNSVNIDKKLIGFGDKFKPKVGSWSCASCYISNNTGTLYCIACGGPKDDTVPKKPPANIFGVSSTVPGSVDSTTKTSSFGFLNNTIANVSETTTIPNINQPSDENNTKSSGFGDKFKPKAGSWTCKACYICNGSDVLYCVACAGPKDDTVPKKESTNIFGATNTTPSKFTFGFSSYTPPTVGTVIDLTKQPTTAPLLFGTPSAVNSGFKFGFPSEKPLLDSSIDLTTKVASTTANDLKFGQQSFNFTPANIFGVTVPTTQSETKTIDSSNVSKPTFSFNLQKNPLPESSTENGFKLEKQEFSFVLKPKSPGKMKSPLKNTSGCEDESDTENVEEENNTYFTPAIPLPDKVEVKTGEESEEILYCHRAKLYRFTDAEWKERGLGDVKILRHTENGKLRVVMRREQILKICLNHALTVDVDYNRKDDKSWHFVANDFSEGEIELMQFCLRFKTKEIAEDFMKAVKTALCGEALPISSEADINKSAIAEKRVNENISEKDKKLADELKLPYSFFDESVITKCAGCRGCDPDNFVFPEYKEINKDINEDKPLPLEMKKLSLSPGNDSIIKQSSFSFSKSFEQSNSNTNDANRFFGRSNPFNASSTENKLNSSQTQVNENKFVFSNIKSDSKDENKFVFGNPVSFTNADNGKPIFGQTSIFGGGSATFSAPAADARKGYFNSVLDLKQKEGGNIFGTIGGFSFESTSNPISGGNMFGGITATAPKSDVDKETGNVDTNLFKDPGISFSKLAASSVEFANNKSDKVENKDKDSNPLFKNDPCLDFASLAKGNNSATITSFTGLKPQNPTDGFIGLTGNDAFSSFLNPKPLDKSVISSNLSQNDSITTKNAEGEYDPHYEPIIPLPNEIIVSTGEEQEEKLFGERANLYRYDATNKEWKERGVGELKILYHPVQGTYRMILRREQIHKLVLNHSITADFIMNQMNSSGKAFCWGAMNYAEETEVFERLAARFKSVELAKNFEIEVKKCVEQLKKTAGLEPEED